MEKRDRNCQTCEAAECVHLSEREEAVCTILCSSQKPVTFSMMKEELHLHQEKLTRVLKRLAFYGCSGKTPAGWIGLCCR